MKTPWKAGALVSVQLTDGPPREMRIATVRRTGPGTVDVTLEAVSGPDELVCTCPLLEGPGGVRMGISLRCEMHGENKTKVNRVNELFARRSKAAREEGAR